MRATRGIVVWSLLSQLLWLPVGLVLGLTVGWWLAAAPVAAALAALAVLLVFMLTWQRADARRESLLATGTRVPAVLVSSRATRNRVRHRRIMAHTFEARLAGGVLRVENHAFAHLPVGTPATIAYDAADSSKAVIVEDLDERNLDPTFRKSS